MDLKPKKDIGDNMARLKVGDKVIWRGGWGFDPPETAKVKGIEMNCVNKEGTPIRSIDWSKVNTRSVIVNLDNGHWAYGTQITPYRKNW